MKYSKSKLLETGIEKLRNFGFVNVNRNNLFEDEVYTYHFKKYLSLMLGQDRDLDNSIKELISLIDKKEK